jgi:hypothetical protein
MNFSPMSAAYSAYVIDLDLIIVKCNKEYYSEIRHFVLSTASIWSWLKMPNVSASSSEVAIDYSAAERDSWPAHTNTAPGGDTGTREVVASWEVRSSRSVVIDRVTSPPQNKNGGKILPYRLQDRGLILQVADKSLEQGTAR